MKTFGWTWKELLETPTFVVSNLVRIMNIEAEARSHQLTDIDKKKNN